METTAPTITFVSSTARNAPHGAGDVIPIVVTFSEAVIVTGTPKLALNVLPAGAVAYYVSTSGDGLTLTFNYVVSNGQTAAPLDYASTTALTLNGGTIDDAVGNAADLLLQPPGMGTDGLAMLNIYITGI